MKKISIIGIIFIIAIIMLAAFFILKPAKDEQSQTNQGVQNSEIDSPITGDTKEPQQTLDATAIQAMQKCVMECSRAKVLGVDLNAGPCLSEQIIADWVCDIAHKPRIPVDDDTANQCANYGSIANHFIEVDPNCNFIRAI